MGKKPFMGPFKDGNIMPIQKSLGKKNNLVKYVNDKPLGTFYI
jgi:hypothetical protein